MLRQGHLRNVHRGSGILRAELPQGGRVVGSWGTSVSPLLVVILQRHIVGVAILPAEDDPPLVVDPDAVMTQQVTLQCLEPVFGRDAQVHEAVRGMQYIQLMLSSEPYYLRSFLFWLTPADRC